MNGFLAPIENDQVFTLPVKFAPREKGPGSLTINHSPIEVPSGDILSSSKACWPRQIFALDENLQLAIARKTTVPRKQYRRTV